VLIGGSKAKTIVAINERHKPLDADPVAGFLFQPQWIAITSKNLKGVWQEVPQFENDFSAWSWE